MRASSVHAGLGKVSAIRKVTTPIATRLVSRFHAAAQRIAQCPGLNSALGTFIHFHYDVALNFALPESALQNLLNSYVKCLVIEGELCRQLKNFRPHCQEGCRTRKEDLISIMFSNAHAPANGYVFERRPNLSTRLLGRENMINCEKTETVLWKNVIVPLKKTARDVVVLLILGEGAALPDWQFEY